jgi:hypothetical protein
MYAAKKVRDRSQIFHEIVIAKVRKHDKNSNFTKN